MKNEIENAQSSKRDENSLFVLTKKFIKLIYHTSEQHINMTHAAQILQVSKRRIYDITNVLECLGMISKWSVNSVKWTGGNADEILSFDAQEIEPDESRKGVSKEEKDLDLEIEMLNKEIADLSANQRNLENAYVAYDDLQKLKIFKSKLVFAVKAPTDDLIIEYPSYQKGAYRLKIMTEKGQISVFYVNDENEN